MNKFFDASSKQLQAKSDVKKKRIVNFKSCFDVIGPIMVGPSSSHTAGALSMGIAANRLFFNRMPKHIKVKYYESFAETHKGHGTDYAIIGGILGFSTDDLRIPKSLDIAEELNMNIEFIEMPGMSPVGHPNTACINLSDGQESIHVTCISVGGGAIEIKYIEYKGFILNPDGSLPIVLVRTTDKSLKDIIIQKFQDYKITINKEVVYEKDGIDLYQFDADTEILQNLRDEFRKIELQTKINIVVLI